MTEIKDIPPVPVQSVVSETTGHATQVWSDWFRNFIPRSDRSTTGYQVFPGGLILQWGVSGPNASGSSTAVVFPLAFPNSCLHVIAGVKDNSGVATSATGQIGTGNYSTTGFNLYNRASVTLSFNYVAIGY